ncbi:hypothetical protein QAD02_002171 [Eretmocerus hayati]|uniref:Uncharacterized protein n=1 Tax=Eretmocerus hayati TaxID=131215 RepID=A0ACC2NII5_9HYME|nr:hypothetical protein QAD02_002171 [Eretmocerus hayati]
MKIKQISWDLFEFSGRAQLANVAERNGEQAVGRRKITETPRIIKANCKESKELPVDNQIVRGRGITETRSHTITAYRGVFEKLPVGNQLVLINNETSIFNIRSNGSVNDEWL